jgi:hypothetical protein
MKGVGGVVMKYGVSDWTKIQGAEKDIKERELFIIQVVIYTNDPKESAHDAMKLLRENGYTCLGCSHEKFSKEK